jgi:alpha-L-rhamnosidase
MSTASYLFDLGDFYAAWLADVRSGQSAEGAFGDVAPRLSHTRDAAAGWGDAGVAVPWGLWEWYGDRQVLEDNLDAMARWPQWIAAQNPDGVWRNGRGNDYGDWLAVVESDKQLFATAWWARSCDLVTRVATLLDRLDVAAPAQELGARVRAAFAAEASAVTPTQTLLLMAREFGLAPWADRGDLLIADVEANGMTVGFQGVRHLLPALTALGRTDLAYELALREEQPGWLAMLRLGATTIWERWDSRTPDGFANPFMNSLCHIALGTVATWLHATVGGLARDPAVVGWRRALVAPEPGGGVMWARTSYDSRLGRYAVDWTLDDGVLVVAIEVPAGGEASVRLPGMLVEPVDGLVSAAGLTTGLLGAGGWRVAVRHTIAVC